MLIQSGVSLRIIARLLRRKSMREEIREELKTIGTHLITFDKKRRYLVESWQIWMINFCVRMISSYAALRSLHRTHRSLGMLSCRFRRIIRDLDNERNLSDDPIERNLSALDKMQRWAAKASQWSEDEFYPRLCAGVGLKDALPLLTPSWARRPWHRR
jgi:hypothetical protein